MNITCDLAVCASLFENRRLHNNCDIRYVAKNGTGESDAQEI